MLREDKPIWMFPPDYIERLRAALAEANPVMFAGSASGREARSSSAEVVAD